MEVAKRMKITPGALSNKLNGNCRNRITPTDDISLKIIEDEFKKSLLKAFEDED